MRCSRLVRRRRHRVVLHCPGQADAERVRRELQRLHARRAAQRDAVFLDRSGPSDPRALGRRLQHRAAALLARLRYPGGVRCRTRPATGGVNPARCFARAPAQQHRPVSACRWMRDGGHVSPGTLWVKKALDAGPFMRTRTRGFPSWPTTSRVGRPDTFSQTAQNIRHNRLPTGRAIRLARRRNDAPGPLCYRSCRRWCRAPPSLPVFPAGRRTRRSQPSASSAGSRCSICHIRREAGATARLSAPSTSCPRNSAG